jgi:hypothetical protein
MLAWNPFGKNQLSVTGRYRNLHLRMQDFFRRVCGIDSQLDGLRRSGAGGWLGFAFLGRNGDRGNE